MSQQAPPTQPLQSRFYPSSPHADHVPFGGQAQVRDREEEMDLVEQVIKTSKIQRRLKKRQRNAHNIPPLVQAHRYHLKKAKRIEKALTKMGYQVKEPSDSESSGDGLDVNDAMVKIMKVLPPIDMNDH